MSPKERNRKISKSFYYVLKEQDRNLRFVMLTGVTKFAQVSVFSGLNNLNDINMDSATKRHTASRRRKHRWAKSVDIGRDTTAKKIAPQPPNRRLRRNAAWRKRREA